MGVGAGRPDRSETPNIDEPHAPPEPALPSVAAAAAGRRGRRFVRATTLLVGTATVMLVGHDGTPGWRVARVVGVAVATMVVMAVATRLQDRTCGRVIVLTGVVEAGFAVGFVPFVLADAWSIRAAASVTALLGGIVLATAGTTLATRRRRAWRRIANGVATLLVALCVGFVVGPAVAATNVPRPTLGATPADRGLAFESVEVTTVDDVRLAGWYLTSTNEAAVVLLHGAGSTRSDVLDQAVVLHRRGFGVLMIDARGHGASGGRAMDFGWDGDADIAAATAFLSARPDVDPQRIGVVGMSMGAEEAIGASGSNRVIRAVVAEGATARVAGDEAWLSDAFGWRGLVQEQLEWLQDVVTDALTSAVVPTSMRAAVESSGETRYLLVAAGDVAEEGRAATYIASGAPDRVEVWTVPGSGHVDGLREQPAAWEARVSRFLEGALTAP